MVEQPIEGRCGSKLGKHPGKFCKKYPVSGAHRCRVHNGRARSGINSPTFKHGRYSKYLPSGLLKKYLQAESDPNLLTHRDELQLIDANLADILEKAKDQQSQDVTIEAKEIWADFVKGQRAKDESKWKAALDQMNTLLTKPTAKDPWPEVREVVEVRKRLLEAETKRLKEIDGTMRLDDVLIINAFTLEAIRSGVLAFVDAAVGEKIIHRIGQDLSAMVGAGASSSLDTASRHIIDVSPEPC